jgi:hypothetical protein
MVKEDLTAELRDGKCETARVALRGLCLMNDAGNELFISDGVVCIEEWLQALHSCE